MPLKIERKLVEQALPGGEGLEPLIRAVWPEAFRLAFGILRDRGLAEDAAQEACAAIARSLSSLKRIDAFPTWSYKIIVNEALSVARRHPRMPSLGAIPDRTVTVDRSEALDLYDALASLTPVQRATVLLHYHVGLRSAEIGAAIGLPASTIRFHLMRARAALCEALGAEQPHGPNEVLTDVH
jgi:RNA polymerase sigma-70 factor, ECF subfamily